MKQEIIFISDLHISLEKKAITRRFLAFLENRAVRAGALYILGDLFDAWIGDDDSTPPNKAIKKQLKQLTASGTAVYLQVGNRDFLLGRQFAEETGVRLLDDYHVIDLFGVQTLLTHGDLLCSDDIAYQQFRAKSRTTEWMADVLAKPLWLRLLAARWYRFRSHFHKRKKTQEIMDVNQQTVVDTMRRYRCKRLIHGHTHRPAVHDFDLDGCSAQRFVLADWKRQGADILCWTDEGYTIERLA
ncbi:UDP-2,3-diacylglucosamine diphosphatase [Methylomarinum sp. Ch1-1]|uniref:UDP-2,3-diacylglucosamine hydrolase n=1 Tax=Methylomarinum roseum TaxID=3067653 RepID=A0AAU7NU19_9GAMM